MNAWNLIDQTFALRLTIALLHFLWQGTAIALAAVIVGWLLQQSSARARYGVHVAALALMAVCVPVTFACVTLDEPAPGAFSLDDSALSPIQPSAPPAEFPPEISTASDAPAGLPPVTPEQASPGVRLNAVASQQSEPDSMVAATASIASPERSLAAILRRSAPYVTVVYFAGVLALLMRLLRGTCDSRRLRREGAELVDPDLSQSIREQAARLKLRVVPALRWCREISVPVVLGVVRPAILLPASAATGLTQDQLRAVIAHELAHIRRYDLAINLLQRMIETLLFFHPAVWWISRQISREREEACDELVLSAGFERTRYADALVRMAELSWAQQGRQLSVPATALAADGASPTEFKRRILKILRLREDSQMRPGRVALLLAAAITVVAMLAPAAWIYLGPSADVQAADGNEATDETMDFLKSVRPDTRITDPAAKGRELAVIDLQAGTKRILYYGKPWSANKPLIDDDSGLPVEIVSGCIVTRDFTLVVDAYNTTMRAQVPVAADTGDPIDPAPDNAGDRKSFDHTIQGSGIELCFSADGTRLAAANGNPSRTMFADGRSVAKDWTPTVDVIDTDTEQVVASLDLSDLPHDPDRPFEQGPTFIEVTAVAFSPDGEVLAVGTSVGQLKLFDVRTGKEVSQFDDREGRLADNKTPDFWKQLPRVMGRVKALTFSPDGKRIAVCGESFADWTDTLDRIERGGLKRTAPGRLKVFDVETGNLKFNPPAHSDMVVDVAYSPDGRYLASVGRWMDNIENGQFGNGILLWDATTGERRAQVDLELRGWMYDIEFSPDGSRILFGAQDFDQGGGNGTGVAAMLSTESLAVLWRRPIKRSAMAVCFNPQQAAVIVLTDREALSYIDAETGTTQLALKVADSAGPQKQRCENFVISPQGHRLAYGIVENGTVHVRLMPIGRRNPDDDQKSSNVPGESRALGQVTFTFDASQVQWTQGQALDIAGYALGKVVHNLQLGVSLPAEPGHYHPGDEVWCHAVIHNAGKEQARFVLWLPQQPVDVADALGNRVPLVWFEPSFESLPTFVALAAGESCGLKFPIRLSSVPNDTGSLGPWWEAPQPGEYRLSAGLSIDVVPSKVPRPEQAAQIFLKSQPVPLQIVAVAAAASPGHNADGVTQNPQDDGTSLGETPAEPAAAPRSRHAAGQEPHVLKVLTPDGSPARLDRVHFAQRGFPLVPLPRWFGELRTDGFVSLADLPDAADWLVVESSTRTAVAAPQPGEPRVLERLLLPGMSPRNNNLSVKVSVVPAEDDTERLRVTFQNHTGADFNVSERDICLEAGMPVTEPLWGLSPAWTSAAPDRFPGTTIHDGQTGHLDLDWRRWARDGLWYRQSEPVFHTGPTLTNPSLDGISVRVWVGTHGAIPVEVVHPRILATDHPWPGAGTDTPQFRDRAARIALDGSRLQGTWRPSSISVSGSADDARDFPLPVGNVPQGEPFSELNVARLVIAQAAATGVPNATERFSGRPAPDGLLFDPRQASWRLNESYDPPTFDVTTPADKTSGTGTVRRQFLYRLTRISDGVTKLELACNLSDPNAAPASWSQTPLMVYTFESAAAAEGPPQDTTQGNRPSDRPPTEPAAETDSTGAEIRLEGADVSVEGLRQLEGQAWGTVTLVDGPLNGEIAHALARARSIRTLRIFGGNIAGYVSWLHVVPGVVELELGGTIIPRDLRAIGEWTQLEHLKLPQQMTINVSGARSLAQLVNLKSLDLYYVDIDDASFAELAPLVHLEELDLTHTRVTDNGLETLARFPQLRKLYLHRFPDWFIPEQLTDAGVPRIAQLRHLEVLSISGKITDDGLRQLAALAHVKQLNLLNTEITPAGLAALEDSRVENLTLDAGLLDIGPAGGETIAKHLRACRHLKAVTFSGGHGSFDAAEDLQKLLPGIGISFNDP